MVKRSAEELVSASKKARTIAKAALAAVAGKRRRRPFHSNMSRKAEIKESNFAQNNILPSVIGTVVNCVAIEGGTTVFTRIGRHITAKGIRIKYYILPPKLPTGNDIVKVALVHDKAPDALTPSVSAMFETSTDGLVAPLAFKNTATNRDRFTILWENEHWFYQDARGSWSEAPLVDKYINFGKKGMDIEFANSLSVAPPITNGLFLVFICASPTGTQDTQATINYNAKLTYTDE